MKRCYDCEYWNYGECEMWGGGKSPNAKICNEFKEGARGMNPNKKTPEEMVVYLKRQITDMEEDAYKLKAENARLKELNKELVKIIKAECADCKVEELNREMVEALTMVYKNYHNDMSIYDLTQVYDAIAKAGGREPVIKGES